MSESLRIVFFGTPDFAVTSLEELVQQGMQVVAVVTAPDKPAGRGMQVRPSPVKVAAVKHGIPVLQPVKLKDPLFLEELKSYRADIQVVIAFRMLPELVWNMPRLGTMNLHASLLPDYRGAAPINWAIIRGEKETGVTTFFLKHAIDTGDMLLQERCPVSSEMNAGDLHDKLSQIGAKLVVKSLRLVESGNYAPIPQPVSPVLKHAPKLYKNDCKIDWNQDAESILNLIRGLAPFPGAFTILDQKILKIFKAKLHTACMEIANPGSHKVIKPDKLLFRCKNEWIEVLDIQLENKKRMHIFEFLKGFRHS
ncbi:MAG: methionyl-tRNA formyltransferase [Bacteroidia bacterium]|jgi:methionyl-tRNA formyltransferase